MLCRRSGRTCHLARARLVIMTKNQLPEVCSVIMMCIPASCFPSGRLRRPRTRALVAETESLDTSHEILKVNGIKGPKTITFCCVVEHLVQTQRIGYNWSPACILFHRYYPSILDVKPRVFYLTVCVHVVGLMLCQSVFGSVCSIMWCSQVWIVAGPQALVLLCLWHLICFMKL